MKRNPSRACYAASLLLLAMSFGCSKDEQPPAVPAQGAAQPAKPAAPAAPPVQKQLSTAVKAGRPDFSRRTDPFKPFAPVEVAPATAAQPSRRSRSDLLPIQSYEAGKFRVAGIIAGLKENRALLIDPAGKGYVVQEGMLVGSNDGRISRITASSVEVVENFREDSGRTKKRRIVLTLTKKR